MRSNERIDLDAKSVEMMCRSGRQITDGPLNSTFAVDCWGTRLFVRERLVDDLDYGQTFAGERYVPLSLREALRIPRLHAIVPDETGRERFALFDFIDGREPLWSEEDTLCALAQVLATIHTEVGTGLGNVGSALVEESPRAHIRDLIVTELQRLPVPPHRSGLRDLESVLGRITACLDGELARLCHGDVHRGNFLVDGSGHLWTIDWEALRYRVAAADFNQLRVSWLTSAQAMTVLQRYCAITGRDSEPFLRQVTVLRILWHLRTYNFHTRVLGRVPASEAVHLDCVSALAKAAL